MSANDPQNHREWTDAELVGAAKSGQLQAFGELVERSQGLARAVAYSASGEPESVEDLVQEALVTAWTRLHDLSDPAAFRPWLAGIVRNTARYWRRHQGRHAPRAQAGMETLSQLASAAPSPLEHLQWQQDWQHTARALKALPAKYREPLVMFYSLGESHAEVARALGLSEASARQRVHRARKKLASEVGVVAAEGRRLAACASAAAGVLLVIQKREAWAAAPVSAPLITGASPKVFLGLGALGGAAIVACIAAFVLLVGGESESIGSPNARLSETRNPSPADPIDASKFDSAIPTRLGEVGMGAGVVRDPNADTPGDSGPRLGLVRIGAGKVRDSGAKADEPAIVAPPVPTDATSSSIASKNHGRIKKHGPAILHVEEAKPLLKPDIDMQAVKRELWQ